MRSEGKLTQVEAERLLAFTNNSGPLFIIGTVGITLFGNSTIGILLFITHLLSCISVGFIFRFWKYDPKKEQSQVTISELEEKTPTLSILSSSIMNSINTIVLIGGFVVLFSVILSILQHSGILIVLSHLIEPIFYYLGINTNFCIPFLSGIVELTNGVSLIASVADKSISTNIIISSFLLGLAGISILLQVYSITINSDISIKPYILGKILQGSLSALYTYIIIKNISFFNFDLEPVFAVSSASLNTNSLSSILNYYNIFILIVLLSLVLFLCLQNRYIKKKSTL